MNLIVNLLSDQTVPNVQFIKEFRKGNEEILFITTNKMLEKGVDKWILAACSLPKETFIHQIVINPFNIEDIIQKLSEFDYDKYEDIIVNVTGGTKIMSLMVNDFFKNKGAKIFYVTGNDSEFLKIFPDNKKKKFEFEKNLTLEEYLLSYGFKTKKTALSGVTFDYTERFFRWFIHDKTKEQYMILNELRKVRDKGVNISNIEGLKKLLLDIDFQTKYDDKLTKYEIRYLTGDWFEEYIYYTIQNNLDIDNEDLQTGLILNKDSVPNEFDIMFLYKNRLYIVECKTYLNSKEKPTLANETIYKSATLIRQLGLFGQSYIFTLNSKEDIRKSTTERATLLKMQIVCKEDIENQDLVSNIFHFK